MVLGACRMRSTHSQIQIHISKLEIPKCLLKNVVYKVKIDRKILSRIEDTKHFRSGREGVFYHRLARNHLKLNNLTTENCVVVYLICLLTLLVF